MTLIFSEVWSPKVGSLWSQPGSRVVLATLELAYFLDLDEATPPSDAVVFLCFCPLSAISASTCMVRQTVFQPLQSWFCVPKVLKEIYESSCAKFGSQWNINAVLLLPYPNRRPRWLLTFDPTRKTLPTPMSMLNSLVSACADSSLFSQRAGWQELDKTKQCRFSRESSSSKPGIIIEFFF